MHLRGLHLLRRPAAVAPHHDMPIGEAHTTRRSHPLLTVYPEMLDWRLEAYKSWGWAVMNTGEFSQECFAIFSEN
jgi:hypothetical protein